MAQRRPGIEMIPRGRSPDQTGTNIMEFDFTKNAVVENVDAVPEKYRGLYVQATEGEYTGKFVVSAGAKALVEAYIGTNTALASARADKKTSSDESATRRLSLKAFEDLATDMGLEPGDDGVAAAFKLHIEELTGKVKGGAELKINLDKINKDWEKRMAEANAAKDKEIEAKDTALNSHLVGDVATRALAEAKGSVDLLLPHVKTHCKVVQDDGKYVVRVVDTQGDFRSNGSGGFMGVTELVAEMKGQESFARAFDSEAPSGSGARPGSAAVIAPKSGADLSSMQKISQGLKKGQHVHGAGA